MQLSELTLEVDQEVEVNAAVGDVFKSLLKNLSEESSTPDGTPMPMVLEPWPGGRWFRDLGDKQGHLWGHVQVIKSPGLLEIHGPMFMSYPVAGHIQFRLTQVPGGTRLTLKHRALGLIEEEHRKGVVPGWSSLLSRVKDASES